MICQLMLVKVCLDCKNAVFTPLCHLDEEAKDLWRLLGKHWCCNGSMVTACLKAVQKISWICGGSCDFALVHSIELPIYHQKRIGSAGTWAWLQLQVHNLDECCVRG